ncbi:hypothetical protein I4U23_022875 [Adineta vaga]|nr:hypothetical protein I4U23_022875 [Adineta vaga]
MYAIVFNIKRFLSTGIRNFMQERQSDISLEKNRNKSNSASLARDSPTIATTKHVDRQSISQDKDTSSFSYSSTAANVSCSIMDNDSHLGTNIDSRDSMKIQLGSRTTAISVIFKADRTDKHMRVISGLFSNLATALISINPSQLII